MRVFIREEKRDVHIRIYGIGGEQRTKEFFDAVFVDMSCVYPTTEEERAEYGTTGVYTFESRAAFDKFCEYLEILQETLDTMQRHLSTKIPLRNTALNMKITLYNGRIEK